MLPHGATTLAVRALLDRTILEVFIGNGRLAITSAGGDSDGVAAGVTVGLGGAGEGAAGGVPEQRRSSDDLHVPSDWLTHSLSPPGLVATGV